MYVFCTALTTNAEYFSKHHYLIHFYNIDAVCLIRAINRFLVYYDYYDYCYEVHV